MPVLLFFPELTPHYQPEFFRILVKSFAHVGRVVHVQLVQLFQQQQRLIVRRQLATQRQQGINAVGRAITLQLAIVHL